MEWYFATKLEGLSPGGLTRKVHRFWGFLAFVCLLVFVLFCFLFFFLGGGGGYNQDFTVHVVSPQRKTLQCESVIN